MRTEARITAVLGPTNTGKTHYAIERMLGHRTGIIGLPLRLLAREVYDRVKARRGPNAVALVTGEERIVPERARYWVCTVESMPESLGADFLAVDEIQLCADPERGHVFTDRLLRSRGMQETYFMGAATIRGAIRDLVPGARFLNRERLSELAYAGARKIGRMPARSAIVGFSVENLYAIAELVRRRKGGAAIVMGALSPRTRNAQVELYQNGDVDYLVATDAIGMGLNLDIDHVAFSALTKFDGRRMRQLAPSELAQIAGRAGRHMNPGSFGVTGEAPELEPETATAIRDNRFAPLKALQWRNHRLEFGSIDRLIASLEEKNDDPRLRRAREADDLIALRSISAEPDMRNRLSTAADVRLLWDVCRVPDFRGIGQAEHAALLRQLFAYLHEDGRIPEDWFARQARRLDNTRGDIDSLSVRLAHIRTWTYVAQRKDWIDDENHWREETRAVEDRLSDALHRALTQRFVDRRGSVLMRRLKQKERLVAEVNDKGEVSVEGEFVGKIEGFRFRQDTNASPELAKTLRASAYQALAPEFRLLADRFYNAPDTAVDFTDQGDLVWDGKTVGRLSAGEETLKPRITALVDEEAGQDVAEKVSRRLQHFIDRRITLLFGPLLAIRDDQELDGLARGFGFRMIEALGLIPRERVAAEVRELDQQARGSLRKHGVRFGQFTVFMPLLLKPAPTRLRLLLWSLREGHEKFRESPPPGLVTIPAAKDAPRDYHLMAGYRSAGERAIRVDMLERLADLLRGQDSRDGFEATSDMLSITGATLEQFADLLRGLGYTAKRGEREKTKPAPAPPAEAQPEATEIEAKEAPALAEEEEKKGVEAESASHKPVGEAPTQTAGEEGDEGPEVEVFYIFTRERKRPNRRSSHNDATQGRPRGGPKGKRPPARKEQETHRAEPRKKDRIDPDNPFAVALMGLSDKR